MKILIIDANNSMHRAYHSYSRLQNNGKPVSIIYGLPILVNALINQFKPDDVYMCWDGGRSPHRMKLLPTYKAGRRTFTEEDRAAFDKQKETVKRLFYFLGVKQIIHPTMEADDWVYMLVRKFQSENKLTIVSTDKDFHQLIRGNVKVYNTAKRLLIHRKNLQKNYGYTPEQCIDYLCLTGDDSDNIPGYRGIGPATAMKFLNQFGSIKNYLLDNHEETFKKVEISKLASLYKLNRKLIDLRYFYRKFLEDNIDLSFYKDEPDPKLKMKALFKLCDKYSIRSLKENKFLINYR